MSGWGTALTGRTDREVIIIREPWPSPSVGPNARLYCRFARSRRRWHPHRYRSSPCPKGLSDAHRAGNPPPLNFPPRRLNARPRRTWPTGVTARRSQGSSSSETGAMPGLAPRAGRRLCGPGARAGRQGYAQGGLGYLGEPGRLGRRHHIRSRTRRTPPAYGSSRIRARPARIGECHTAPTAGSGAFPPRRRVSLRCGSGRRAAAGR